MILIDRMFDFGRRPTCPHNIVERVPIDHYRADLICKRCGELMGWYEDLKQDPQLYITGPVRKLTEKEMKELA